MLKLFFSLLNVLPLLPFSNNSYFARFTSKSKSNTSLFIYIGACSELFCAEKLHWPSRRATGRARVFIGSNGSETETELGRRRRPAGGQRILWRVASAIDRSFQSCSKKRRNMTRRVASGRSENNGAYSVAESITTKPNRMPLNYSEPSRRCGIYIDLYLSFPSFILFFLHFF